MPFYTPLPLSATNTTESFSIFRDTLSGSLLYTWLDPDSISCSHSLYYKQSYFVLKHFGFPPHLFWISFWIFSRYSQTFSEFFDFHCCSAACMTCSWYHLLLSQPLLPAIGCIRLDTTHPFLLISSLFLFLNIHQLNSHFLRLVWILYTGDCNNVRCKRGTHLILFLAIWHPPDQQ